MTSKLKVNVINDSGDNNLITSDGSGSVTLGTAFPAVGKIGQVITASTTTQTQTTSSSFTDSTITANITPQATSSKVLILIQYVHQLFGNSSTSDVDGEYKLIRTLSSTDTALITSSNNPRFSGFSSNSGFYIFSVPIHFEDSPNTINQCTYKLQIAAASGRHSAQQDSQRSQITLMEVLP